jgi:hypothetical protein
MGDEVIVPAYKFFVTAATEAAWNAITVIVEVEDFLTLDPGATERVNRRRTVEFMCGVRRGRCTPWWIWQNAKASLWWKKLLKLATGRSRGGGWEASCPFGKPA